MNLSFRSCHYIAAESTQDVINPKHSSMKSKTNNSSVYCRFVYSNLRSPIPSHHQYATISYIIFIHENCLAATKWLSDSLSLSAFSFDSFLSSATDLKKKSKKEKLGWGWGTYSMLRLLLSPSTPVKFGQQDAVFRGERTDLQLEIQPLLQQEPQFLGKSV